MQPHFLGWRASEYSDSVLIFRGAGEFVLSLALRWELGRELRSGLPQLRGWGGAGRPESALAWLGSGSGGGTEEERQGLEDPGWDLFGLGAECGMVT